MTELQEQLVAELRDLLDAEKQITKALPKMAKVTVTPELKEAFLTHLEQTKGQITRLERVFELLGERAKSKPCKAMQGLIAEAQEHIQEGEKGELLDNELITCAQKVEHYEIAGYGTVFTIAKNLGQREVAALLQETLKEEGATDKLLTQCSLQIQKTLMRKPSKEESGSEESTPKKKVAASKKEAAEDPAAPRKKGLRKPPGSRAKAMRDRSSVSITTKFVNGPKSAVLIHLACAVRARRAIPEFSGSTSRAIPAQTSSKKSHGTSSLRNSTSKAWLSCIRTRPQRVKSATSIS